MAKYRLQPDGGVFDTERNHSIPPNTSNRHWVEYEDWLAAGNTPDPADPPPPPPRIPTELEDGNGGVSRAEMNDLKAFLRGRFGYE